MGLFFGTDGIRGEFEKDLTIEMAYRCGRALALQKSKAKILIGRDTRGSGEILTLAFSLGAIGEGVDIVDVGVCPTAGISYLTQKGEFDFGVVISASHNAAEFNGIKVFDDSGKKLGDKIERDIEKKFFVPNKTQDLKVIGKYICKPQLTKQYEDFLAERKISLDGLKIILDCANGASSFIASKVFEKLKAEVIAINNMPDGSNINKNCGALHLKQLQKKVLSEEADIGFAFDGDSDRVVAVDEKGNIVDGDKIIYLFAREYLQEGKLENKKVVGTLMTNMGVEVALNKLGIDLVRTDVGDKYVGEALDVNSLLIGGEQCGHVFVKDKLATGDGILNAILIAEYCKNKNKKLSQFFNFKNYEQVLINVEVKNKNKVLECKKLRYLIQKLHNMLKDNGRVVVRPSGTEPLIRIMVESKEISAAKEFAEEIKDMIKILDKELLICVE